MEMFLWAAAAFVASFFVASILAPKPADAKPAALADFDLPRAEEGTPQAVIFGDCWTGDWQVLWYGNYRTEAVKGKSGKGK